MSVDDSELLLPWRVYTHSREQAVDGKLQMKSHQQYERGAIFACSTVHLQQQSTYIESNVTVSHLAEAGASYNFVTLVGQYWSHPTQSRARKYDWKIDIPERLFQIQSVELLPVSILSDSATDENHHVTVGSKLQITHTITIPQAIVTDAHFNFKFSSKQWVSVLQVEAFGSPSVTWTCGSPWNVTAFFPVNQPFNVSSDSHSYSAFFCTLMNSDRSREKLETMQIAFSATVLDKGHVRQNSAMTGSFMFSSSQISLQQHLPAVVFVEPDLSPLNVTADGNLNATAGGLVILSFKIAHTRDSRSTAFHVRIHDGNIINGSYQHLGAPSVPYTLQWVQLDKSQIWNARPNTENNSLAGDIGTGSTIFYKSAISVDAVHIVTVCIKLTAAVEASSVIRPQFSSTWVSHPTATNARKYGHPALYKTSINIAKHTAIVLAQSDESTDASDEVTPGGLVAFVATVTVPGGVSTDSSFDLTVARTNTTNEQAGFLSYLVVDSVEAAPSKLSFFAGSGCPLLGQIAPGIAGNAVQLLKANALSFVTGQKHLISVPLCTLVSAAFGQHATAELIVRLTAKLRPSITAGDLEKIVLSASFSSTYTRLKSVDSSLLLRPSILHVVEPRLAAGEALPLLDDGDAGDLLTFSFNMQHVANISESDAFDFAMFDKFLPLAHTEDLYAPAAVKLNGIKLRHGHFNSSTPQVVFQKTRINAKASLVEYTIALGSSVVPGMVLRPQLRVKYWAQVNGSGNSQEKYYILRPANEVQVVNISAYPFVQNTFAQPDGSSLGISASTAGGSEVAAVTIGERVHYTVVINIPEGKLPSHFLNFTLVGDKVLNFERLGLLSSSKWGGVSDIALLCGGLPTNLENLPSPKIVDEQRQQLHVNLCDTQNIDRNNSRTNTLSITAELTVPDNNATRAGHYAELLFSGNFEAGGIGRTPFSYFYTAKTARLHIVEPHVHVKSARRISPYLTEALDEVAFIMHIAHTRETIASSNESACGDISDTQTHHLTSIGVGQHCRNDSKWKTTPNNEKAATVQRTYSSDAFNLELFDKTIATPSERWGIPPYVLHSVAVNNDSMPNAATIKAIDTSSVKGTLLVLPQLQLYDDAHVQAVYVVSPSSEIGSVIRTQLGIVYRSQPSVRARRYTAVGGSTEQFSVRLLGLKSGLAIVPRKNISTSRSVSMRQSATLVLNVTVPRGTATNLELGISIQPAEIIHIGRIRSIFFSHSNIRTVSGCPFTWEKEQLSAAKDALTWKMCTLRNTERALGPHYVGIVIDTFVHRTQNFEVSSFCNVTAWARSAVSYTRSNLLHVEVKRPLITPAIIAYAESITQYCIANWWVYCPPLALDTKRLQQVVNETAITLGILPGVWCPGCSTASQAFASSNLMLCPRSGACEVGGHMRQRMRCAPGHMGAGCAACKSGWVPKGGSPCAPCIKCSTQSGLPYLVAACTLGSILVGLLFLAYSAVAKRGADCARSPFWRPEGAQYVCEHAFILHDRICTIQCTQTWHYKQGYSNGELVFCLRA